MTQIWYLVLPLSALAALLAAGPEPASEQPPRPLDAPADDIPAALDDLAREIADEEGRIDHQRIRRMIDEARNDS